MDSIEVSWPTAPRYDALDPAAPSGYAAWVAFKLYAAGWHLDVLRKVAGQVEMLDRWVGVEMAIDGVLGPLSGAFDSAVVALTKAVEDAYGTLPDGATADYKQSWKRYRAVAKAAGVQLPCEHAVVAALVGEAQPVPKGWLAQMRRLRNRVTHQLTAARAHHRGTFNACNIILPDGSDVDLLTYLDQARLETAELVQQMISDARAIAPHVVLEQPRGDAAAAHPTTATAHAAALDPTVSAVESTGLGGPES